MAATATTIQTAIAHHQAGRLREAEQLYRQILAAEPRNADALHLLGLVAYQCGQFETAIDHIGRAIALVGNQPVFYSNLGEVYRAMGRADDAERSYREALRLDPTYSDAHNNLGNVYLGRGQLAEAEAAYREAIRHRAHYAEAISNLGVILLERGEVDAAVEQFRRALAIDPRTVSAANNLATALVRQGKADEAEASLQTSIRINASNAELRLGLGMVYQGAKQFGKAVECYREALRLGPPTAKMHHNLGAALREMGQLDEAVASYRAALTLAPDVAETHGNLAIVLAELGQTALAEAEHREALRLKPDDPTLECNFGMLLEARGSLDEALAMYQQAVSLEPDFAQGYFSLGSIYQTFRMPDEAAAAYRRAIELEPNYPAAYNNLAMVYNDTSRPDLALEWATKGLALAPDFAPLFANMQIALHAQGRSEEAIEAGRKALELRPDDAAEHSNYLYMLNFFPRFDAETIFAEHLKWARCHAEPLTRQAAPHTNDRTLDRRLRVGYLSPYFRQHAVNFFVEPILASHDHDRFEIFCYADLIGPDATTARLKPMADHWREIAFEKDEQIAQLVRDDGIDILVDLTGHIGNNRMLVFARKPAPVQVTYIGYQNTTGMSAMDYRLTDAWADPPGVTDRMHTERLVRLAPAFFCYRPSDDAPSVTPLPALERGYVTFGSFNNVAKVTQQVTGAWLQLLKRVPNSRLLMLGYRGGCLEQRLRADAEGAGIDPNRIELADKRPRREYLQLVSEADIALDPFPFNGHTTTCDSIWQGVPVVMLAGQTYASRFGGSVLLNVGQRALIAESVEQYIDIAGDLAGNLDRLAALRAGLRAAMAASPLVDYTTFTRNLEAAYRNMWHAWCSRQARP